MEALYFCKTQGTQAFDDKERFIGYDNIKSFFCFNDAENPDFDYETISHYEKVAEGEKLEELKTFLCGNLQDKLHRRNMQIKELKKKYLELHSYCQVETSKLNNIITNSIDFYLKDLTNEEIVNYVIERKFPTINQWENVISVIRDIKELKNCWLLKNNR